MEQNNLNIYFKKTLQKKKKKKKKLNLKTESVHYIPGIQNDQYQDVSQYIYYMSQIIKESFG